MTTSSPSSRTVFPAARSKSSRRAGSKRFLGMRRCSNSCAIVLEDQLVTAHHLVWSGILGKIESILDHLKNDIVAGQSEDEHDHSGRAFGRFETVDRGVQLRDEIAIKLRFGMSVKTDFVVEIGYAFARHQLPQGMHQGVRTISVYSEIRTRVCEKNRQIRFAEEHGI